MDSVPRLFFNQVFIEQFDSSTIALVIVLLFVSALFSAGETAFFSVVSNQATQLKPEKNFNDRIILNLLNKPDVARGSMRLMATSLIIRSLANAVCIILVALHSYYLFYAHHVIVPIAITLSAILLLIIFAEVIPKTIAVRNNLATARLAAIPMSLADIVVRPLTWLLLRVSDLIERMLKQKNNSNISMDELGHALAMTIDDKLSYEENRILEGIVTFGDKEASQIMTSRVDVTFLYQEDTFEEVIETVIANGYSRLPVAKGSPDNITGFLVVKDLLAHTSETDFNWQTLVKPPFFIPENKRIDDLLQEFRKSKTHIAIVVDEYGGTSGIVTMEDILEEIVGEISDEFDDDELQYSKLDNHTYIMEGKIAMVDFYKILDIDSTNFEDANGDTSTLAGFVIEQAGYIPDKGDVIFFEGIKFVVEAADKRRIKRLKIILP